MFWQLRIFFFLNKLNVGSIICNMWCIESPYKRMEMWAPPFLKFNTYGIIFCFVQGTVKYDLFEKCFSFIT